MGDPLDKSVFDTLNIKVLKRLLVKKGIITWKEFEEEADRILRPRRRASPPHPNFNLA